MWRRLLGLVAAVSLVAAGCGDDDGSGATTTASVPALTTVTDAAWDTSTVATTIVSTTAAPDTTTTVGSATVTPCVADPATVEPDQPPTGTSVVVTQPPTGTTLVGGVALRREGDVYQIDWDALTGPVGFAAPSGSSQWYLVHSSPDEDGFLFSVEAHTGCGSQWSGQPGTFAIGCSTTGTGICVHFDPDGNGPEPDLGADHLTTGTIEILQADTTDFVAVLSGLAFTDGSTIPGPFTISR
jgi:hypothetical protein